MFALSSHNGERWCTIRSTKGRKEPEHYNVRQTTTSKETLLHSIEVKIFRYQISISRLDCLFTHSNRNMHILVCHVITQALPPRMSEPRVTNCKPMAVPLTAGRLPSTGENGGDEVIVDPEPSDEAGAALKRMSFRVEDIFVKTDIIRVIKSQV